MVGIGRDTVSKWERGIKAISLANLEAIAVATRKSMSWFLEAEETAEEDDADSLSPTEVRRIIRDELKPITLEIRHLIHPPTSKGSPGPSRTIPLLGQVAGGPPRDAVNGPFETVDVPAHWVKRGEDVFALRVHGDSMEPTICRGDVIVVRKQPEAVSGQIVVALIQGTAPEGEAAVKRLFHTPRGPVLKSDNPAHPTVPLSPGDAIAGVVVRLIRDF